MCPTVECQKKVWKTHKPICKNYKIGTSVEEHGRHIIASRDIRAGEKIMDSNPDVLGPRLTQPVPCCLGCHRGDKQLLKCPKCALPVCGVKCTSSSVHQMECAVIYKYKKKDADIFGLETVLPFRILALQYTQPEVFLKILSMESNKQEIVKGKNWKSLQETVVDPILALGIPDVDRDTLENILGIILTNTFEVVLPSALLIGIFYESSFMNHHCIGNTRIILDKGGKMTVTASVPIKKNKPIKFNYVKGLDSTWLRQQELLENKYFSCACERCLDPTELGSYVSGHRCLKEECEGSVIPTDPLNKQSDWKCDKCQEIVPVQNIRKTLKCLSRDTESLDKNNMKDLKRLINKYESKLHRQNGLLADLKQMLISGYGRLPGFQVEDMNEADHKLKLRLVHEVLGALDIVDPGLSLGRGLLLFELHTTLVILSNLEFEKKQNPNQLLIRLLEAEKYLAEADTIMKLEPPTSPYGHLSSTISRNRIELGEYIQTVKMM
ncbi:protein msta isoform X2 [Eurytemora carolleeae]|uniref:protein msta isoform X2 n=1 Tax=Eurytemora carolleeae TaxID=1294199 RepID=UPI000C78C409|nr:protein msta isoform X2 [Eurytemora carolleeae]|eukprot:XP_023349723.1 protein msta-like isoform X2 [Eurytemora affinis]